MGISCHAAGAIRSTVRGGVRVVGRSEERSDAMDGETKSKTCRILGNAKIASHTV